MILGYSLIILGVYWLLASMGLIPVELAKYFWPILFISIGSFLVFKKQNK